MNTSWSGSNRSQRLPSNWPALRRAVLKRDNYTCRICTVAKATEVDHVNPGDNHSPDNLRAVCTNCHKYKSSKEGNAAKAAMRRKRFRKKPTHPGRLNSK